MTEPDEVVTLSLPAQARYIRLARLAGAGLANDLGVDLDDLDDIRLAIGEACGLASQFGASSIDIRFSVTNATLHVRGDAHGGEDVSGRPPDHDQFVLVKQILDVACTEHELVVHESGLSFSLTFTHGT